MDQRIRSCHIDKPRPVARASGFCRWQLRANAFGVPAFSLAGQCKNFRALAGVWLAGGAVGTLNWIAIRLAGYIQKTVAKNPAVLPALEIVRMATINGARALQLDHLIGSLEVGKRADLIVLDADSPSLTPNFNPHTTIATSVTRADVVHVLVDGKVVVRDRKCLTIDHKSAVSAVKALGKQVLASVSNN